MQVVDLSYDDPVIAGGMLGDDLTLEGGEGVGEQRHTAASDFPVETGESVRAGTGRAFCERLVLSSQDVHAETPLNQANAKHYRKSAAITDYKEFPGRSHFILGQAGWEDVADWAVRASAPLATV
jgi:hypothetical protein